MVLDLDIDEGAEDDSPGYIVSCSCSDGVAGERSEKGADLGITHGGENKNKEQEVFMSSHLNTWMTSRTSILATLERQTSRQPGNDVGGSRVVVHGGSKRKLVHFNSIT